MVAIPAETPVTTPVENPTEAILVLLELQTPPLAVSESVVVAPEHTLPDPAIGPGTANEINDSSRADMVK